MSPKMTSYKSDLDHTKCHKLCPGTRDKLESMLLGVNNTSPKGPVLVT